MISTPNWIELRTAFKRKGPRYERTSAYDRTSLTWPKRVKRRLARVSFICVLVTSKPAKSQSGTAGPKSSRAKWVNRGS